VLEFLKKFIGKKPQPATSTPVIGIETAPLSEEQLQSVLPETVHVSPPQYQIGMGLSVGRQREVNEDTIFALSATIADGVRDLPFGIFVLADGMGGHASGEVASAAAAKTMAQFVLDKISSWMLSVEQEGAGESIQEIMESGVREAHRAVLKAAPGGGTTLTAVLALGEQITIAHVGDSRVYFIYPDGRVQIKTQDHSLVHRLKELGQITDKEASTHPQRNILYRALGQTEPFRPDIITCEFPHPGTLLLCSDGLWGVLPEESIAHIVNTAKSPSQACQTLVESANLAGGPDNISVILAQYLS
jgi:serine/threonine protein phosphatase PrpC